MSKLKNIVFLLAILSCLSSCIKPDEDNCTVKCVNNFIPQELQTYFPYKLGQKLSFSKYEDSVFIKEINFIVDTMILTKSIIYTQAINWCGRVDTNSLYTINLHNLTDTLEDIKIFLYGNDNYSYTKLYVYYNTSKNGTKYTAHRFSDYVLNGINHQGETSNFTRFGHNYGTTHNTSGSNSILYLNNAYGIILLDYNYLKDQLILKP